MLDFETIRKELHEELGREPTNEEIEYEIQSRICCLESMCDEIDARHEAEDAKLIWNGDY